MWSPSYNTGWLDDYYRYEEKKKRKEIYARAWRPVRVTQRALPKKVVLHRKVMPCQRY